MTITEMKRRSDDDGICSHKGIDNQRNKLRLLFNSQGVCMN